MSRIYQIDCRQVKTYEDFVEAFNKTLIQTFDGQWNGNLDALHDYLSWPEDKPYQLVILGADQCAKALTYKKNSRHEKELWSLLHEIFVDNKEYVHVLFK